MLFIRFSLLVQSRGQIRIKAWFFICQKIIYKKQMNSRSMYVISQLILDKDHIIVK